MFQELFVAGGAGVQQGSGLVFHIGPHIVPCGGQLRFFQIKAEKNEVVLLPETCARGMNTSRPRGLYAAPAMQP